MPKVPVQQLQEVAPRPLAQNRLSSAGATPDAFGAALGRALEGPVAHGIAVAGNEFNQIALDNLQRDRTRKLLDINTAWQAAKREKLYGTPDNPNGFYTRKGNMALDTAATTDAELEELRKGFLQNIDDEEVAIAFEKASGNDLEESRGQMARYVTQERTEAEKATRNSVFLEAVQAAAADPANETVLAQSLYIAEQAALEQSEADGFSPTDVATLSAVEKARSAVLKTGIESLARTDGMAAMELFKKHEGLIDGDTRAELAKTLETATVAEYAQGVSDHIMSMFGNDQAGALAYARETLSGEREDEVIKRINAQFNEMWSQETRAHLSEQRQLTRVETAQRQAELSRTQEYKDADRDLTLHINNGGSVDEWAAEHPLEWSTLKSDDVKKFYELETEQSQRENFAAVSDAETLAALAKMTPEEKANINVADYQGKLSYKDFKALDKEVERSVGLVQRRNEAAEREVERKAKTLQAENERKESEAYDQAMSAVQTGTPLDQWARENPEMWKYVTEKSLAPLRTAETAFIEGREYARVTDGKTMAGLKQMGVEDPRALAEQNLDYLKPLLTQQEWTDAARMVGAAKTKIENADNKLYPAMRSAISRYAPKSYGFDKANPSDTERKKQQWVLDEMDAWIAEQITSGSNPTPSDIEKAAQDLMVRAIKPDTTAWYQSSNEMSMSVREAQKKMTPEQKAQVIVRKENIPPARLNKIEEVITSHGFASSDELIEELAGAYYMNDRKRYDAIIAREKAKKKGTQ